jgi:hypothetical protein
MAFLGPEPPNFAPPAGQPKPVSRFRPLHRLAIGHQARPAFRTQEGHSGTFWSAGGMVLWPETRGDQRPSSDTFALVQLDEGGVIIKMSRGENEKNGPDGLEVGF